MEDSCWPKIYQWTPHGRRRRGRPQQLWRNQVTDFMRSRNKEEDMAENWYIWLLGVDRWLLAVQILIRNNLKSGTHEFILVMAVSDHNLEISGLIPSIDVPHFIIRLEKKRDSSALIGQQDWFLILLRKRTLRGDCKPYPHNVNFRNIFLRN